MSPRCLFPYHVVLPDWPMRCSVKAVEVPSSRRPTSGILFLGSQNCRLGSPTRQSRQYAEDSERRRCHLAGESNTDGTRTSATWTLNRRGLLTAVPRGLTGWSHVWLRVSQQRRGAAGCSSPRPHRLVPCVAACLPAAPGVAGSSSPRPHRLVPCVAACLPAAPPAAIYLAARPHLKLLYYHGRCWVPLAGDGGGGQWQRPKAAMLFRPLSVPSTNLWKEQSMNQRKIVYGR